MKKQKKTEQQSALDQTEKYSYNTEKCGTNKKCQKINVYMTEREKSEKENMARFAKLVYLMKPH